jgi:hypothetical protein
MRLIFVLDLAHPTVVALLADTLHPHFRVVHALVGGLPDSDVYRLSGLEVFENPV